MYGDTQLAKLDAVGEVVCRAVSRIVLDFFGRLGIEGEHCQHAAEILATIEGQFMPDMCDQIGFPARSSKVTPHKVPRPMTLGWRLSTYTILE